jgi:PAS domain S-box-containing protein
MSNEERLAVALLANGTSKVRVLEAALVAFRGREAGFREVLQHLPAAIYTTDAEGRITYFNEACVEFSGRTPALGSDAWCVTWKLFNNDGTPLPHDECPMAVALKECRVVRGVTAIAERPNGSRVHFMPFPTPLFDEDGALIGAVNMLVDLTETMAQAAHLKLVSAETNHRANNLLAVVRNVISMSDGESVAAYKRKLEGRVDAIVTANNLIAESRWQQVNLLSLLHEELRFYGGRATLLGEPIAVSPRAAQTMAMVLHELATNAAKFGALSHFTGQVRIRWWIEGGVFRLQWSEEGGPPVAEPLHRGLGSRVIVASMRSFGGKVEREWLPSGLVCTLTCEARKLSLG